MMLEIYQQEKQKMLDDNFEKYMNNTLKELQKEYQQASKDIEREIAKWLIDMDVIKQNNPNFAFSELHYLQDLQKQINLIIEELARVEKELLTNTLKELYVVDYMDLNRLNAMYGLLELNTPLPQFNQIQAIQVLETYINMPTINETVKEIARKIDVKMVADPISGRYFDVRILDRAEKLEYSIEDTIRQGILRGDGYNKVADRVAKELYNGTREDLERCFNSAKTLVRTEMATVENMAEVHQAMKNGFTGMKWVAYHGSDSGFHKNTCKKCRAKDGTIYPIGEIKASDLLAHPNCRCELLPCMIDENGKEIKSSYQEDMDEYIKNKAREINERNAQMKK